MTETAFDRAAITEFRFLRWEFDPATGEAKLVYAFDGGEELVETIRFPKAPYALPPERMAAVGRALRLLPAATAEGDVFVVADAGAYGYAMASRYNLRELPQEEVLDD